MAIILYCPACGTRFAVDEIFLGQTVSCTGCGRGFPLPARGAIDQGSSQTPVSGAPAHTRAYQEAAESAGQEEAGSDLTAALADLASAAQAVKQPVKQPVVVQPTAAPGARMTAPAAQANPNAPAPGADPRRRIKQSSIFLAAGGILALVMVILGLSGIMNGGKGKAGRGEQGAATQATQNGTGQTQGESGTRAGNGGVIRGTESQAPLVPNPRPGNHFVLPVEVLREASIGPFNAVVYPLAPASMMAVFRGDPGGKHLLVERWTIYPWNKTGEVRLEAEEADTGEAFRSSLSNVSLVFRHSISAKGTYLARLAHSKIEIWSFDQKELAHAIDLSGRDTSVQVLGFYDDEHLATLWLRGGGADASVEVYSAKSGKPVHKVDLPRSRRVAGNYSARNVAFSPDGKTLAAGTDLGTIVLFDLATGAKGELKIATRTEPVHPSQVSFSGDGSHIAALFDKAGEPSIAAGRVDGGKLEEVRYQELDTPYTQGQVHAGRTMDFLPDNRNLLLYGQVMIDVVERRIVGQLEQVPAVRMGMHTISQRQIGPGTFQLEMAEAPVAQGAGGVRRMLRVAKLELER